ncbi:MAG: TrkH family potassium uptake protein [Eubacteriales bacterium]|nr:TrkH family potassium uptake protein [Eubacteriales bacterium]
MGVLNPARVLVLGFLAIIIIGALLLMLPQAVVGERLGALEAFFTSTSAVCVTGLVVVDTGTTFSVFGQLVIMFLIQIGGLGFMTMATLIFMLLGRKISFRNRLLISESLNQFTVQGVVALVRIILVYTLAVEGSAALILALRFSRDMGWIRGIYYGVFHAVSAFCNAGFDLMGNFSSLAAYRGDPVVNLVIMALIISGGLGFTVIRDFVTNWRKAGRFELHSKLVLIITALLLVSAFLAIFVLEFSNPQTLADIPWGEKVLATAFTATTPRTAGFNTLPIDGLRQSTLFLIIILMFIGASPASTGGGIKTATFGVILVAVHSIIRGESDAVLFKRRLPQYVIHKALAIIIISIGLIAFVTLILCITEPFDFMPVLFEVVSAFGTVGLSVGITPGLSAWGKLLIIFMMFVGRVGPVTLTLAFGQRLKQVNIRYPEGRVMVG